MSKKDDLKSTNMMCPILTGTDNSPTGCWGAECGWWSNDMQCCGVAALASGTAYWMKKDDVDKFRKTVRRECGLC